MRMIIVALGLALLSREARAQEPPRLTLGELYREVERASPRVAAAQARADAARARIGPASRWPDPAVQLALMNRNLPRFGINDPLGMNQIQVMQMVPVAGKTGLATRAARVGAEAESQRTRETAQEVRAEAAMRFFDLYQADATLAVMTEGRTLLEEALRAGEAMYASGGGSQAALLRAQVELARMDEALFRMRAMRATMAAGLNALQDLPLAAPVPTPVLPRFPTELPPVDRVEALALARRPMLAAGALDAEASEFLARRAAREIWPDLTLGVIYGQRPMPDGGTDRMASVMLGFTLPLTPGSRQRQMTAEARAMHAMAVADLADMRLETRTRVGALVAELERTSTTGRHYRTTLLPELEAATGSARAGYRSGLTDFMTLLESEMNLIAARQDLIRLDAEAGKAWAELEMLTTTTFLDAAPAAGVAP